MCLGGAAAAATMVGLSILGEPREVIVIDQTLI